MVLIRIKHDKVVSDATSTGETHSLATLDHFYLQFSSVAKPCVPGVLSHVVFVEVITGDSSMDAGVFVHSRDFLYWEENGVIQTELVRNLVICTSVRDLCTGACITRVAGLREPQPLSLAK